MGNNHIIEVISNDQLENEINVPNGMAIIDVQPDRSRSIWLDREIVELAKLNKKIKNNREKAEAETNKMHLIMAKKRRENAKNAYRKQRFKVYTINTWAKATANILISSMSLIAMGFDLISPYIAIPFSSILTAVSCIKIGIWFGRLNRNK